MKKLEFNMSRGLIRYGGRGGLRCFLTFFFLLNRRRVHIKNKKRRSDLVRVLTYLAFIDDEYCKVIKRES